MYKQLFFYLLITLSISACNIINPEEEIPAYIQLEDFEFTPGQDGSTSEKLTDAYLYVGGDFIGAFEVPNTIPVLASGEQMITIDPGIKDNGITASPNIYPFYKRFVTDVTLVPGETTIIRPKTTYDDEVARFVLTENFENSVHKFNEEFDANENTKIIITEQGGEVKEGDGSGYIYLDQDNSLIVVGSSQIAEFPEGGINGYLELDYKTTVPLLVGVTGANASGSIVYSQIDLGVNPRDEWNKIYFDFTEKLNSLELSDSESYRIIIQAQIPIENGEFTEENAEIYLDNIKLIIY